MLPECTLKPSAPTEGLHADVGILLPQNKCLRVGKWSSLKILLAYSQTTSELDMRMGSHYIDIIPWCNTTHIARLSYSSRVLRFQNYLIPLVDQIGSYSDTLDQYILGLGHLPRRSGQIGNFNRSFCPTCSRPSVWMELARSQGRNQTPSQIFTPDGRIKPTGFGRWLVCNYIVNVMRV